MRIVLYAFEDDRAITDNHTKDEKDEYRIKIVRTLPVPSATGIT